jgi:5-methylcytosine-specific restriction enzyme subunit McrC
VNIVLELTEDQPKIIPEPSLSEETGRLLRENFSDQVDVEAPSFLNDRNWKITSKGYVGFIPLGKDTGLALRSKIGLLNLFGMIEYAYQLDLKIMDGEFECATLEEFHERLAHVLAKRLLKRQIKGLYRSYASKRDEIGMIRGRLDLTDAITRPWKVSRKCEYEEHTADIEDNRILLWTMRCISKSGLCSERVMPTIRKCYRDLMGIAALDQYTFKDCIGRLYNRLNSDYEVLHGLCRFFLEQSSPLHALGENTMFPFLIDMSHLYELFVAEWLKKNLPKEYTLQIQSSFNSSESKLRFTIDLVICDSHTGEAICVLDTKYKCPDSRSNPDIYQVVTYAEVKGCKNAILIYPQELEQNINCLLGETTVRSLDFNIEGDLDAAGERFLKALAIDNMSRGV